MQGTLWRLPDLDRDDLPVRKAPGAGRLLLPYWAIALALTGAVHLDLLPERAWLKAIAPPASAADSRRAPEAPVRAAAAPLPAPAFDLEVSAAEAGASLSAPVEPEPEAPADAPVRIAEPSLADHPPPAAPVERPAPVAAPARALRSEPELPTEPLVSTVEEPAPAVPALVSSPEPAPKPARASFARSQGSAGGGLSCEAALANYRETLDPSHPPDLSAADYAGVLNNGRYFSHCGVPARMAVHICVAVQDGQAKGVTVRTSPASGAKGRCVARAVWGLSYPSHPRMDVARALFK